MSENEAPTFLVDSLSDPVLIRVQGRASFQNSDCLQQFIEKLIASGKTQLLLDFQACTSMDSTFLGVMAGSAMKMRKLQPKGSLIVCRLNPRNLELMQNLGLHRLLVIDQSLETQSSGAMTALDCSVDLDPLAKARMVLKAHENLVEIDETNRPKFEDVLQFLREQTK